MNSTLIHIRTNVEAQNPDSHHILGSDPYQVYWLIQLLVDQFSPKIISYAYHITRNHIIRILPGKFFYQPQFYRKKTRSFVKKHNRMLYCMPSLNGGV